MRALGVLHLVANPWWTGSADPTLRVVLGLQARGHRVWLALTPGDRFEAKAREAGVAPVAGVELRAGTLLGDVRRLRALVRTEGVDLVHAHHSHDHWVARLVAGRRPIARTFHNARSVRHDALARRLYRRTAAVFVASGAVRERCVAAGIPADRCTALPGVADLERFTGRADARRVREELGLGEDPVVVCVARLAPRRGHEALLAAFPLVRSRVQSARLVLVGKGENREHLERAVKDLGLGDVVVFAGYRDRDLPDVLAAADCFVQVAAGSDESCRATLEAMAAARPVVARQVGALPDTVVHGETGLLVADDRPETIAAALSAVLDDPARARAMGAAGRRRAETAFAPERAVSVVEAVYRGLA